MSEDDAQKAHVEGTGSKHLHREARVLLRINVK